MNSLILLACFSMPINIEANYQPTQVLPEASTDVKLLQKPIFPLKEHSILKNLRERIKNRRDSK